MSVLQITLTPATGFTLPLTVGQPGHKQAPLLMAWLGLLSPRPRMALISSRGRRLGITTFPLPLTAGQPGRSNLLVLTILIKFWSPRPQTAPIWLHLKIVVYKVFF